MSKKKRTAKGIPDRGNYGNISTLPLGTPLTFVEQYHEAKKAGPHTDYRIGTPGGMFSWALPKGLPKEPGQKHLAVTQPLHSWSYNDFEGTIGKGYGAGHVTQVAKGEVVLLARTPQSLKFVRSDVKNSPIYNMIKTKAGNWITFIQSDKAPPVIQLYSKERFKSVPITEIADIMDAGDYTAVPKIDGAGAIATVKANGVDVYSVRKDKDGNLIRYTDHIGDLRNLNIPKELEGKSFRAEVFAEQDGKVLPPQTLSGILNSTLSNAVKRKLKDNIRLRLAALALLDEQGEHYDPAKVKELVKQLNLPNVTALPEYRGKTLTEQIELMKRDKHPLTNEGLVLYTHRGRPIKSKLMDEADVVIRDIFEADTKSGARRAGGFTYSLPGSEEIVGRVGSGVDHQTLKDMLSNPDDFIGRTARISNFGQFESGAYRAPSFISLHEG